jgi:hypothetical protein
MLTAVPIIAFLLMLILIAPVLVADGPVRKTRVSIEGRQFLINGKLTYPGRVLEGRKIEGLLLNSRMVQGIFDDDNPETRTRWTYPDGTAFDADRNTDDFIRNIPIWREHGLLSFTINLQGGSPEGYSKNQPWRNSAFTPEGELKPAYLKRLARILDRADELGMVPIVGYFYFGQAPHFKDEAAVIRATDNATDWLIKQGYTNILIEIANESGHPGYPPILQPPRAHELIERVRTRSNRKFLVSTSQLGGKTPPTNLLKSADFVLVHGNGVHQPDGIRQIIQKTRATEGYNNQPILINEDDHFDFDKPDNNFLAALDEYASWGYFDFRMEGETFKEGYQSLPVDWSISSDRKRGFFNLLKCITENQP